MVIKILDLESERRDVILNAALKEFVLKGFDGASTNVIAKEAGISKSLMFHYVNSKQDLFLFVYDYFAEILEKEYFTKIDLSEKDIFARLHQSYLLQINLIQQYPWIFEFDKLSLTTISDEVNKELEMKTQKKKSCDIFSTIDSSKFRVGLDVEKCKQIIFWANVGFTNQVLNDIRNSKTLNLNYEYIISTLDGYLNELKKTFYGTDNEQE